MKIIISEAGLNSVLDSECFCSGDVTLWDRMVHKTEPPFVWLVFWRCSTLTVPSSLQIAEASMNAI